MRKSRVGSDTHAAEGPRLTRRRPACQGRAGRGVVAAGLVLALALSPTLGLGAGAGATTLYGVEGFRLEIGAVSQTARALGMDRVRLRGVAGRRLRRAALPMGDFPTVLVVSLHSVAHPGSVLAYCLDVEVRQIVRLSRTEQVTMLAPTWAAGKLTLTLRGSFVRSVEDALGVLLDDLVRDYRLVNAEASPEAR